MLEASKKKPRRLTFTAPNGASFGSTRMPTSRSYPVCARSKPIRARCSRRRQVAAPLFVHPSKRVRSRPSAATSFPPPGIHPAGLDALQGSLGTRWHDVAAIAFDETIESCVAPRHMFSEQFIERNSALLFPDRFTGRAKRLRARLGKSSHKRTFSRLWRSTLDLTGRDRRQTLKT